MPLSEKARFLGSLEIFSDLNEEELADLDSIADEFAFEKDAMIAYPRDMADRLIIVREGRLFSCLRDKNGVVRDSRSYFSGDYFNDTWLFTTQVHSDSVRGAEPGRFIFIEQKKFLDFLKRNRDAVDYLLLSDEANQAARGSPVVQAGRRFKSLKLLPDEIVAYEKRRSIAVLLFNIGLPIVLAILLISLIAAFLGLGSTGARVIVLLLALLTLFIVIWRVLDWANDYFVITSKHIIHREYSLQKFKARINKIPVDQVQSVEILKPNFLSTALNVGSARITTAAQSGTVIFDNVDNPAEIQDIIEDLRAETQALDEGRVQQDIRALFDKHFDVGPGYNKFDEPADDWGDDSTSADVKGILSLLRKRLTRGVGTKIVAPDGTITYRKHPVTLLGRTMWPMLVGLLLIILIMMSEGRIRLFFAGLLFLDFLWYIWKFEDWRNETFQLTDRLVVDIDRRPFFFGVSRKQAELANVQNVSSEKPSLFANLFNFGNVKIETAGASPDIIFESVGRPNRVQRDVFQRREAFKSKQRKAQLDQRRQEYAVVVDVYQQAQEIDHIPRRI